VKWLLNAIVGEGEFDTSVEQNSPAIITFANANGQFSSSWIAGDMQSHRDLPSPSLALNPQQAASAKTSTYRPIHLLTQNGDSTSFGDEETEIDSLAETFSKDLCESRDAIFARSLWL
jgi:hypothetical protein